MIMRYIFYTISLLFLVNSVFSQKSKDPLLASNPELQKKWVDSVYNTMTLKEKIGQLYTIQVFSNEDEATKKANIEFN